MIAFENISRSLSRSTHCIILQSTHFPGGGDRDPPLDGYIASGKKIESGVSPTRTYIDTTRRVESRFIWSRPCQSVGKISSPHFFHPFPLFASRIYTHTCLTRESVSREIAGMCCSREFHRGIWNRDPCIIYIYTLYTCSRCICAARGICRACA